jgi:WD40 repeat protein
MEPDVGPGLSVAFFSTDGSYVITNNGDNQDPFFRIWEIDSGTMINGFGSDDGSIIGGLRVEFSDDDERLVLGQFDGTVVVFDFTELRVGVPPEDAEIIRFAARNNLIASVRLSADGSTLATNGRNEPVALWTIETGEPLGELGEGGDLPVMAWDPSGLRLYVAEGGTVSLHSLDVDELIGAAQDRLTRTMTEEECQRYFRQPCKDG